MKSLKKKKIKLQHRTTAPFPLKNEKRKKSAGYSFNKIALQKLRLLPGHLIVNVQQPKRNRPISAGKETIPGQSSGETTAPVAA